MIEPKHPSLSVLRQCELVSIRRPSFYHQPVGETAENLALMRLTGSQFLEMPWSGLRQMARHLRRDGHTVGRKLAEARRVCGCVRRFMAVMGLVPIYPRPRTTVPNSEPRVWPYLLRGMTIDRPNQVWCTDVTYVPMRRGFPYRVAVVEPRGSPEMDWATRKVLSWRMSNTTVQRSHGVMSAKPTRDVGFCVEALEEASARFGRPAIFNSDQGRQFTSSAFTGVLQQAGVRISMDGRGRWMDCDSIGVVRRA